MVHNTYTDQHQSLQRIDKALALKGKHLIDKQLTTLNQSQSQVLALAALLQSAYLVHEIATKGDVAAEHYNPLLQSLFDFDPEHTVAIYGGIHGINKGLVLLASALGADNDYSFRPSIRYALNMIHLQGKLDAAPALMSTIRSRLQHTHFSSEHFGNDINKLSSSVAAAYKDTVSTFKSRIHVTGNAIHLQNTQNADKIRTLLLAGIRAAVLWRQMGGKRWHFLFSRKRMLKATQSLIDL